MVAMDDPAAAAVVHSQSYALQDVQIQGDLLELSPELLTRYTTLLDQGKHFPIDFTTWTNSRHVLLQAADQDISTTRALSLLKTVFISFSRQDTAPLFNAESQRQGFHGLYTQWNTFLNPRWTVAGNWSDDQDNFNWQVQIGGRHWPAHQVRGVGAESYYHFRQSLDMAVWGQSSFNINDWAQLRWVGGLDLETSGGSLDNMSYSGFSTRAGEPLTFKIKGFDTANMPDVAYIHLCHDATLTISRGVLRSLYKHG